MPAGDHAPGQRVAIDPASKCTTYTNHDIREVNGSIHGGSDPASPSRVQAGTIPQRAPVCGPTIHPNVTSGPSLWLPTSRPAGSCYPRWCAAARCRRWPALVAQRAHQIRSLLVIRNDQAAFSRGDLLVGVEGEYGCVTKIPVSWPQVLCPQASHTHLDEPMRCSLATAAADQGQPAGEDIHGQDRFSADYGGNAAPGQPAGCQLPAPCAQVVGRTGDLSGSMLPLDRSTSTNTGMAPSYSRTFVEATNEKGVV